MGSPTAYNYHRQPSGVPHVIVTTVILLWFGLALWFTAALCRAASIPVPQPSVTPPAPMGPPVAGRGATPGTPAGEPSREDASEDPPLTLDRIESGLDWTCVMGRSEGLGHAWWACPQRGSADAHQCRQALDERPSAVGQVQEWVTG